MLRRKIFVYQQEENDCGLAALSMILRCYGSAYPLRNLRRMISAESNEISALRISDAAADLGFKVDSYFCDYDYLIDQKIPQIVSVRKQDFYNHYYVILSVKKKSIRIADPAVGIKTISRDQFESEWTGFLMCFNTTDEYSPVILKNNELKPYINLLLGNRKWILISIFLAILSSMIGITTAVFIEVSINYLIPSDSIYITSYFCFGLVFVYFFKMLIDFYRNTISIFVRNKMMSQIDEYYFRYLMEVKINFYSMRKTGDILSRFTDSSKIVDSISNLVTTISLDLMIIFISFLFMFYQDTILAGISLLSIPIYASVIFLFKDKYNYANFDQLEKNASLNSDIIESVKGIENIKSLRAEMVMTRRIDNKLHDYILTLTKSSRITFLQKVIKEFIQSTFILVILGIGVILIIKRKDNIGNLMSMLFILSYYLTSVENIVEIQPNIQLAQVTAERLNNVLGFDIENYDLKNIQKIDSLDIKLKDISFRYGDEKILESIDLSIPFGEIIGITGESGSGKSTLAKLMVGFIEPTNGEIDLGSYKINDLSVNDIRSNISYIPQHPYLFSGTIRDNLLIGNNKKISDNKIERVCREIGIQDKISNLNSGLDEIIEEGANQFSGGQQQKLMIVRAILSDTKVIIFDEATSGIDDEGVNEIINRMKRMNKTLIFITHQKNVLNHMDTVYRIENHQLTLEK